MRRVLVANRGEIAMRAVRARRQLSLESLAVYSSADANSPHRWAADRAICIGPPEPRALARFQVPELTTTIPFHSHLLQRLQFMRAEAHTRWVQETVQGSAH